MSEAERIDTRQVAAQVITLLESELATAGYELLDVRIFRGGGRVQVRLYVDVPGGGITLDQCAKASRTAGMLLEEADLFAGPYVIEVSSPGIRRPLRTRGPLRRGRGPGRRGQDGARAGCKGRLSGGSPRAG